ncbi:MAG: quinol oxidase [Geobacteraceae bacterium]|nr:quinol oxidase [Geobacteraceae bacterium]
MNSNSKTRFFNSSGLVVLLLLAAVNVTAADSVPTNSQKTAHEHDHGTWIERRTVATIDSDGVQRVKVIGGEYFYNPNHIVVKVNKPVELIVKKYEGYIPHNLVAKAPEAGIEFNVDLKDAVQAIKFTPTRTGKFPIYCDKGLLWFKTHREKGMEGLIEVVE